MRPNVRPSRRHEFPLPLGSKRLKTFITLVITFLTAASVEGGADIMTILQVKITVLGFFLTERY